MVDIRTSAHPGIKVVSGYVGNRYRTDAYSRLPVIEIKRGNLMGYCKLNKTKTVRSVSSGAPPLSRTQTKIENRVFNIKIKIQLTIRSSLKEDLTTCGDVENNPGPNYIDFSYPEEEVTPSLVGFVPFFTTPDIKPVMHDENLDDSDLAPEVIEEKHLKMFTEHLAHMTNFDNGTGKFYNHLCSLLDLPTSNRYAALTVDDVEHENSEQPTQQNKTYRIPRKTRNHTERDPDDEKRIKSKGKEVTPLPTKPVLTEQERINNRLAAEKRIADSLIKMPDKIFSWLKRPMSGTHKMAVLDLVFGQNWMENPKMDQYMFSAYCNVVGLSRDVEISTLIELDRKWTVFSDELKLGLSKALNFGYLAAKQLSHNKEMHMSNGNILSNVFKEVEELVNAQEIIKPNQAIMNQYRGIEAQVYLTNVVGDMNPNHTKIYDQDRIRGNVVMSDNTVRSNCAVPLPMTCLIPRTSVHGDATTTSTQRLRVTETNTAEYYLNPIQATDLSKMISDQVKNNQSSNWRRDNNSLAGFSTFDVATINVALSPKGLSLESMLLKLDMLHSIKSLATDGSKINRSIYQAIAGGFEPDETRATIVSNRAGQPFGESCGANQPEFPWVGGSGKIAFHLSLASVPIERRDQAVIMPAGLLQAAENPGETIALFALSLCEWPPTMYTVRKTGHSVGGGGAGLPTAVDYVPTQCLTRVAGYRTLDIILPKRFAEAIPTTAVNANAQASVRPTAGPRGTVFGANSGVAIAADALLNVNYVGGAEIFYPLCGYIYTWANEFDTTTIRQYIGRLGVLMGVKNTLLAAHEINIALCQQYPKLGVGEEGTYTPARDSLAAYDMCYSSHIEVNLTTTNFPLNEPILADYRIFETNILAWNKVCLGLATAPNLVPDELADIPYHLGNPSNSFWERLESIPMAATWAIFYNLRGMTAKAWDDAYTNSTSIWAQKIARGTFSTAHATGTIIPSRYGVIKENIMKTVYGRAAMTVQTSKSGSMIDISHFGRWLPGGKFAGVYDGARELKGLVPTIIPDIWIQYPATNLPLFAGSFPPPFHKDSTQGFNHEHGLTIHRNMNNDLVSPYVERDPGAFYNVNSGPSINDKAVWNSRLWFTHPNRQILDFAGNAIDEEMPPAGQYPLGRYIQLLPGEFPPPELANAATICIPRFSSEGKRIYIYVTQAQSVQLVGACTRQNRLARSAWLLSDVYVAPQVQQWGSEVEDEFDLATKEYFLDVTTVDVDNATKQVPATLADTGPQAVDVTQLPSSVNPSSIMQQPTSDAT